LSPADPCADAAWRFRQTYILFTGDSQFRPDFRRRSAGTGSLCFEWRDDPRSGVRPCRTSTGPGPDGRVAAGLADATGDCLHADLVRFAWRHDAVLTRPGGRGDPRDPRRRT